MSRNVGMITHRSNIISQNNVILTCTVADTSKSDLQFVKKNPF